MRNLRFELRGAINLVVNQRAGRVQAHRLFVCLSGFLRSTQDEKKVTVNFMCSGEIREQPDCLVEVRFHFTELLALKAFMHAPYDVLRCPTKDLQRIMMSGLFNVDLKIGLETGVDDRVKCLIHLD